MWRRRRKGHKRHGCTRTFPPYTWYVPNFRWHFLEEKTLEFPHLFWLFRGACIWPSNSLLRSSCNVQVEIHNYKEHPFHPHLNWIAFSFSRSHFHRLEIGSIMLFNEKLILCWCELNSHGKLRQLNNWEGRQHSHPKEEQPTSNSADWLWNRQILNGGDNTLNINAPRLQVRRYSKAHLANLKPHNCVTVHCETLLEHFNAAIHH